MTIQNPYLTENNQTYCYLSKYQLVASCVLIVVTILFNIFSIVKMWIGDQYVDDFIPSNRALS